MVVQEKDVASVSYDCATCSIDVRKAAPPGWPSAVDLALHGAADRDAYRIATCVLAVLLVIFAVLLVRAGLRQLVAT